MSGLSLVWSVRPLLVGALHATSKSDAMMWLNVFGAGRLAGPQTWQLLHCKSGWCNQSCLAQFLSAEALHALNMPPELTSLQAIMAYSSRAHKLLRDDCKGLSPCDVL